MRISPSAISPSSEPARRGLLVSRTTILLGALLVSAVTGWAGLATWYILCRDEFAQAFIARQQEMQYGYEDRIADLKRRLEIEVTQNLAERNAVDERLRGLGERQAQIEGRQGWLRSVADMAGIAVTGSLGPAPARSVAPPVPAASADPVISDVPAAGKPQPLFDTEPLRLRSGGLDLHPTPRSPRADRLGAIERRLEAAAAEEVRIVGRLAERARGRLGRLRAALDATGLDVERRPAPAARAMGGPFVPLPAAWREGAFGSLAASLETARQETQRLRSLADTLPLRQPLSAELELTSSFGYRMDPFTRIPALHTGSDFRAEYGAPVLATAAGRVTIAEWTGGYGNLVEIDHGGGVATRYGHLSGFAVAVGDTVAAGGLVGRAGSTGRSTGVHVHYETRINGEPVNPVRFLQAGRLIDRAE